MSAISMITVAVDSILEIIKMTAFSLARRSSIIRSICWPSMTSYLLIDAISARSGGRRSISRQFCSLLIMATSVDSACSSSGTHWGFIFAFTADPCMPALRIYTPRYWSGAFASAACFYFRRSLAMNISSASSTKLAFHFRHTCSKNDIVCNRPRCIWALSPCQIPETFHTMSPCIVIRLVDEYHVFSRQKWARDFVSLYFLGKLCLSICIFVVFWHLHIVCFALLSLTNLWCRNHLMPSPRALPFLIYAENLARLYDYQQKALCTWCFVLYFLPARRARCIHFSIYHLFWSIHFGSAADFKDDFCRAFHVFHFIILS